jgi:GTP-binding protein Era
VRGIAIAGASQLVFIDTPGIFAPRRRLDRAMVDAAATAAGDADIVVMLVDAQKGVTEDVDRILRQLANVAHPRVLVLNKIDRVKKEDLLALAADLNTRLDFPATFMISALKGSGVEDLKAHLASHVPEGIWHFPADDLSDIPERQLAAEITREKLYERLHQELPYAATVETTAWQDRKDGSARIEQTIFVERDSQRVIVLGEGGRTIKDISMRARKELSTLLERPVHLFLHVKVQEGWGNDPERYRNMGLDYPKE